QIGGDFEKAVLKSIKADKDTTAYPTEARTNINFRFPESVTPDTTGYLVTFSEKRVKVYYDSYFVDVKQVDGTINLSYDRQLIRGYIDVLSRSPARKAGKLAVLEFITVDDTRIGDDVLKAATAGGILVYQRKVFYRYAEKDANNPLIVGPRELL